MNPKLVKMIAKIAVMGIGSVMIGQIIKTEKNLQERIDEHFTETKPEPDQAN